MNIEQSIYIKNKTFLTTVVYGRSFLFLFILGAKCHLNAMLFFMISIMSTKSFNIKIIKNISLPSIKQVLYCKSNYWTPVQIWIVIWPSFLISFLKLNIQNCNKNEFSFLNQYINWAQLLFFSKEIVFSFYN